MSKDRKRTFLECMLADLDRLEDSTDEEVELELKEMGINIEEAKKSFLRTIKKCKARNKK